jgi:hypothetical protein
LHLSDGVVYEIRHPELVKVKLSIAWLYFPAATALIPAAEQKVVVTLRHIVRIEFLPPAAPLAAP